MRPERRLIEAVHRHLPMSVLRQSMTTASLTTNGTPDYYYDRDDVEGDDLWVEYKALTAMPRSGIVAGDYSALQMRWLTRRWKRGKNAVGIVGLPNRTAVIQCGPRELEAGTPAADARPIKEIAQWIFDFCGSSCGPRRQ